MTFTQNYYDWLQQFKNDDTKEGILARYIKPTDSISSINKCAGEMIKKVYFKNLAKWYRECAKYSKEDIEELKWCTK